VFTDRAVSLLLGRAGDDSTRTLGDTKPWPSYGWSSSLLLWKSSVELVGDSVKSAESPNATNDVRVGGDDAGSASDFKDNRSMGSVDQLSCDDKEVVEGDSIVWIE